ncbi:MAG: hypothetical protein V7756_07585 [Halopseudomonas sp.]|uniref:hypothetical protein n=1 Tax=Halopseudomonas sp. TaxID=2901191 RepID=UPI003002C49D
MRLDGLNPYPTLPERSNRSVSSAAPVDSARSTAAEQAATVSASRALTTRSVNATAANAEYIPARRETQQPVYGYSNQALASYEATANLPVDGESDYIAGIDLFA